MTPKRGWTQRNELPHKPVADVEMQPLIQVEDTCSVTESTTRLGHAVQCSDKIAPEYHGPLPIMPYTGVAPFAPRLAML